ncbi:MAG: hypothetical protein J6A28_03770 [Clostridia bacterium]|nr:hypothetical protein [Clostridia bacterium]
MDEKSNKKISLRVYVISGMMIAASLVLLLVFLLVPGKRDGNLIPLNCSVESIEMEIGESKADFYHLSHDEALVSFKVDKEGIIEIDEQKITALKSGVVTVQMTVTLNDQSITEVFVVTVLAEEYSLKITPITDCEVAGNTIYLSGTACQFSVEFINKKGETVEDAQVSYTPTNNARIQFAFGVYMLLASEDCAVTFSVSEYNFSMIFNVIIK